jgi:hypothetical protein
MCPGRGLTRRVIAMLDLATSIMMTFGALIVLALDPSRNQVASLARTTSTTCLVLSSTFRCRPAMVCSSHLMRLSKPLAPASVSILWRFGIFSHSTYVLVLMLSHLQGCGLDAWHCSRAKPTSISDLERIFISAHVPHACPTFILAKRRWYVAKVMKVSDCIMLLPLTAHMFEHLLPWSCVATSSFSSPLSRDQVTVLLSLSAPARAVASPGADTLE